MSFRYGGTGPTWWTTGGSMLVCCCLLMIFSAAGLVSAAQVNSVSVSPVAPGNHACTTFEPTEFGEWLTLNINSAPGAPLIESSRVKADDIYDTSIWSPREYTTASLPANLHVYYFVSQIVNAHFWAIFEGNFVKPVAEPVPGPGNTSATQSPPLADFVVDVPQIDLLQMELNTEKATDEIALKKLDSGWSDDTYATDGNTTIGGSNPIWTDTTLDNIPEVTDPICVVVGARLILPGGGKTKINVQNLDSSTLAAEIGVTLTATGDGGHADDFNFGPVAITLVNGIVNVPQMTATASRDVGDKVNNFSYTMKWRIMIEGAWHEFEKVDQRIFVTALAPAGTAGVPTARRLDRLTRAAQGKIAVKDLIDALHADCLDTNPRFANIPNPLWAILDSKEGMCEDWIDALHDRFIPMLLGGQYGTKTFCFPLINGTAKEDVDRDANEARSCVPPDNGHTAAHGHDVNHPFEKLTFMTDVTGMPNNWEAVLKYGGFYYPPNIAPKTAPKAVLQAVPIHHLEWYWLKADGTSERPDQHCVNPGEASVPWP